MDSSRNLPLKSFARASSPTQQDVRRFLQARLLIAFAVLAFGQLVMLFLYAIDGFPLVARVTYSPWTIGLAALSCVSGGGSAVALWLRPWSARVLRSVELVNLSIGFAFLLAFRFTASHYVYLLPTETEESRQYRELFAECSFLFGNLQFFLVIVMGVVIPNTVRRCVVTTVGLCLIVVIAAIIDHVQYPTLRDELLPLAFVSVVTLAMTGAIVVAGTHKVGQLEQQVLDMRKKLRDFGQYKLNARLGGGGMGEVFLAEHRLLKRPCAIKLIHAKHGNDPEMVQRFLREVEATAKLTHPNTIEVFDYGQTDDGALFYVMEYLPGRNLGALVAESGPLPVGRCIHILRQVCGAIREAHQAGMIHRDIKPDNILVCERGGVYDIVKLLDFGLVRVKNDEPADRLTVTGAIVGTPSFMAPEQAESSNNVEPRSDLYSVGAVAYFLLTGQPPFVRENVMRTLMAQMNDPVEPVRRLRPEVSPALDAMVCKLLAKSPIERFGSAGELLAELDRIAETEPWSDADAAGCWANQAPAPQSMPINRDRVEAAATVAGFKNAPA